MHKATNTDALDMRPNSTPVGPCVRVSCGLAVAFAQRQFQAKSNLYQGGALQTIQHCLAPGQTLSFRDIPRTEVRVSRGRVWVTRYGDTTDYFLEEGQVISLQGTRVVVQAESDGASFSMRSA